jgi:hypothetical protein
VALSVALVLLLLTFRDQLLFAAAVVGYIVMLLPALPSSLTTRLELLAVAAVGLVVLLALWQRLLNPRAPDPHPVLTLGLAVLALFARDSQGLGVVAAFLLLIGLAVSDQQFAERVPLLSRALLGPLASSAWPPTATFAGRVLAVISAFAVSWPYGLAAIGLCIGLLLPKTAPSTQKRNAWSLALPAVSLVIGFAPALVFRLLRL